jgi:signal transduction histidine kinase
MELLYANEKELLEMIAQGRPLQEVLQKLIDKVANWSSQVFCSILVEDANQQPLLHLTSPGLLATVVSSDNPMARPQREDERSGSAAQSADQHWRAYGAAALKAGLETVYCKPITSTLGQSLGVLSVYGQRVEPPETARLQLFDKIAHVTSIAIERERSEQTLRRLSRLILNAQEAERRHLARELHDGVSQILSSVAFRVESVLRDLPPGNQAVRREAAKLRFLMQRAVREVRRISENLRPSELDELGLVPAIRELCDEFKERTGLAVQFNVPAVAERFSGDLELALYRVLQEALTNIEKHAGATEVILQLNWNDAFVTLNVRDNGKGLPAQPATSGPSRTGMGLVDMRERCAFLGGGLSIRSEPGFGTEIAVCVPHKPPELESVHF